MNVTTGILFTELADYLGEGGLANMIVRDHDVELSTEYARDIARGRDIVLSCALSRGGEKILRALHRYNRFLSWLVFHFGSLPMKTKEDAEKFLLWKLKNVSNLEGDGVLFFKWLAAETSKDASGILYG